MLLGYFCFKNSVAGSFSGLAWSHSLTTAYKIITQRFNINYKLYGLCFLPLAHITYLIAINLCIATCSVPLPVSHYMLFLGGQVDISNSTLLPSVSLAWISHLSPSCPAIGQSSFAYPIGATHMHSIKIPHSRTLLNSVEHCLEDRFSSDILLPFIWRNFNFKFIFEEQFSIEKSDYLIAAALYITMCFPLLFLRDRVSLCGLEFRDHPVSASPVR